MVGKGDFSWDQACSYSACLYSEFIALCQWINWRKVKAYRLQSHRLMFSVCFSVYLFSFTVSKYSGNITMPTNTWRNPLTCFKTIAEIKPWQSNWLHMCVYVYMFVNALIACIDSNYMINCVLWYVFSLSLFLYTPNCVPYYPLFHL